jgi:hypothetical protein
MSDYIKSLQITTAQYNELSEKLVAEYGAKIRISWVAKRELGFTVREHSGWDVKKDKWLHAYYLDFYSEAAKSYFMLKYM